jgi:hypothetical protein
MVKFREGLKEIMGHIIQKALDSLMYIQKQCGLHPSTFTPHDVFMLVIKYEDDFFGYHEHKCQEMENAITNNGRLRFGFDGTVTECQEQLKRVDNRLQREFIAFQVLGFKIR